MSATSNNIISLRRHDLDNLRTFLTGVVVVHHTAVAYGAPGSTPFRSVVTKLALPGADLPLTVLAAVNQSFFMGLFFWISGRVSAQSLERIDRDPARTRWSFLKSKSVRLGLVAVMYTLVIQPAIALVPLEEWTYKTICERLMGYFSTLRGIRGPVWYTANLLVLDSIAALIAPKADTPVPVDASFSKERVRHDPKLPSWYVLLAKYGWIGAAALGFLARVYYPVGDMVKLTGLQPGYAAQYIFAYLMGHASWKYDTSFIGPFALDNESQPEEGDSESGVLRGQSEAKYSAITAILVSLATLPLVWLPYLFRDVGKDWVAQSMAELSGGWNCSALLYAVWNEFSFVIISPALVRYFSACHNQPSSSSLFQAKYSYGAFLAHMLVSIVPEVAFDRVLGYGEGGLNPLVTNSLWKWLGPSIMTVIVGTMNIYSSFGAAKGLLDAFPSLRRII